MVQLFARNQSLESQIQNLKSELATRQLESESLAAARLEAEQKHQAAQTEAQQLQEQLLELQQTQARERHEAELAEGLRKLRPVADEINLYRIKQAEAIARFKKLVKELPSASQRSVEIDYLERDLPVVLHQEGVSRFILASYDKARSESEGLRKGII